MSDTSVNAVAASGSDNAVSADPVPMGEVTIGNISVGTEPSPTSTQNQNAARLTALVQAVQSGTDLPDGFREVDLSRDLDVNNLELSGDYGTRVDMLVDEVQNRLVVVPHEATGLTAAQTALTPEVGIRTHGEAVAAIAESVLPGVTDAAGLVLDQASNSLPKSDSSRQAVDLGSKVLKAVDRVSTVATVAYAAAEDRDYLHEHLDNADKIRSVLINPEREEGLPSYANPDGSLRVTVAGIDPIVQAVAAVMGAEDSATFAASGGNALITSSAVTERREANGAAETQTQHHVYVSEGRQGIGEHHPETIVYQVPKEPGAQAREDAVRDLLGGDDSVVADLAVAVQERVDSLTEDMPLDHIQHSLEADDVQVVDNAQAVPDKELPPVPSSPFDVTASAEQTEKAREEWQEHWTQASPDQPEEGVSADTDTDTYVLAPETQEVTFDAVREEAEPALIAANNRLVEGQDTAADKRQDAVASVAAVAVDTVMTDEGDSAIGALGDTLDLSFSVPLPEPKPPVPEVISSSPLLDVVLQPKPVFTPPPPPPAPEPIPSSFSPSLDVVLQPKPPIPDPVFFSPEPVFSPPPPPSVPDFSPPIQVVMQPKPYVPDFSPSLHVVLQPKPVFYGPPIPSSMMTETYGPPMPPSFNTSWQPPSNSFFDFGWW